MIEGQHRHKTGYLYDVEITGNYIEYDGLEYSCSIVRDLRKRNLEEQLLRTISENTAGVTGALHRTVPVNSGQAGGFAGPYYHSIPHYSLTGISTKSPIPTMWWRAPGANLDGFACESFVDELAQLAAADPLSFRRAHLNKPRYEALLDKLAELSNWATLGKNSGRGVAITECFGSIVGKVVKVSKQTGGGIKIDKVFAVIDCGWYVNPDIIHAHKAV